MSKKRIIRKASVSPIKNNDSVYSGKTKLLTVFERKISYVPHAEFIKKSDVTLGDKNKLTKLTIINLIIYMGQMTTIIVTALLNNVSINIFDE